MRLVAFKTSATDIDLLPSKKKKLFFLKRQSISRFEHPGCLKAFKDLAGEQQKLQNLVGRREQTCNGSGMVCLKKGHKRANNELHAWDGN